MSLPYPGRGAALCGSAEPSQCFPCSRQMVPLRRLARSTVSRSGLSTRMVRTPLPAIRSSMAAKPSRSATGLCAAHRGVIELRDDAVAGGLGESFDRATLPLPPRHSPNRRTGSPPTRICRPPRPSQTTRPVHLPRSRTLRSRHRAARPPTPASGAGQSAGSTTAPANPTITSQAPASGANPSEAQTTPSQQPSSQPCANRPPANSIRRSRRSRPDSEN